MADTLLADISEYQPALNDAEYLAWSKAIIIRAAYGTRTDFAWYGGARRDELHNGGVTFLGIYQYLVAAESAAAQAEALVSLLGNLRAGEQVICDIEEGTSALARWMDWKGVILAAYPHLKNTPAGGPWLYSGLNFALANDLRPQWIAAYGPAEPSIPHVLWQFADNHPVPGVGDCDCSLFHGTPGDLAELVTPRTDPAPAPKVLAPEETMPQLLPQTTDPIPIALPDGATGVRFFANSKVPAFHVDTRAKTGNWVEVNTSYETVQQVPVPDGIHGFVVHRSESVAQISYAVSA